MDLGHWDAAQLTGMLHPKESLIGMRHRLTLQTKLKLCSGQNGSRFVPFETILTPFESISRDLSIQIIKTKTYMRSNFEGIVSEGKFSEVFFLR